MRLLEKFDALEDLTDIEDVSSEVLSTVGLDDVDPDHVTSWLGTRAAVAGWVDVENEELTIALALASRNDGAARDGLAAVLDASDEEFGYVVDDGLATVVFATADPQAHAEELLAEGRISPLADSAKFQSDLERLDGEQLAFIWMNDDGMKALTDEAAQFAEAPANVSGLYSTYEMTSGGVISVRATDASLEMRMRSDGGSGDFPVISGWRERIGQLRTSQAAGIVAFPNELDETSQQIIESVTEQYNEPPEGVEVYARGRWDYDLALTAEEDAEHGDLLARWEAGSLSESDPNFDRFVDLDDRFWFYGRQSEFDEWIAAGNTEEELLYRGSPTHDEFYEFVELEARFESGELDLADEDRFFELDARLYSFGVVTDYPDLQPEADSVAVMNDVMNEIIDLLSGATLTVAVDEMFGEPEVGLSLELAHGPAERLLDIPALHT
jgi:hypothetical protein